MDIECEDCEDVIEMAEEREKEREKEETTYVKILREAIKRYRINFIEFFLLRVLDLYHPSSKLHVWWDIWYQNKEFEEEIVHGLHGEGEKKKGT